MIKDKRINLLEGNLTKTIVKLGYPLALASIIQMLYNLADTFWLGKLGRHALSAPVISFHIIFLIISIGIGFSVTATSLVSQYIGSNQIKKARTTAGNILIYNLIFSILFSIIALSFAKPLLSILKTPADTFDFTLSYLRIVLVGMPLAFPFFVYQAVMNGYGDTKSPLKIELISVGINLIVDPILIFGWFGFPVLGVKGAALTTVFTRALSSIIGIYLFFSGKKGIKLSLKNLIPDFKILPLMFKIGIPSSLGMAGTSLGFLVLLGIVNKFGTVVISAYGISTRIIHIFMMPAMGISHAITAIVGQNLGAGNNKRAKEVVKKGIKLMTYFIVPSMILVAIFGKYLTMFFIPGDQTVHQIGHTMFLIISPSVLFFALTAVLNGAFQGSGFTVPVMISNLSRIWLFRIPLVYIISIILLKGPGNLNASVGIWWGMFFSNLLGFIIIFLWYLKGNWSKARIEKDKSKWKYGAETQSFE